MLGDGVYEESRLYILEWQQLCSYQLKSKIARAFVRRYIYGEETESQMMNLEILLHI